MNLRTDRMRIRTIAGLMFVCAGLAQTEQNFSGTWKLDESRSTNFGTVDQIRVDTIWQEGSRLKVKSSLAIKLTPFWSEDLTVDGKPHAAVGSTGRPETVTSSWQGSNLIVRRENSAGENQVEETWSLSPDGQVLTIVKMGKGRPAASEGVRGGAGDRKLVFTKTGPATR